MLDLDVAFDMDPVVVGKVSWGNQPAFVASRISDHLLDPMMQLVWWNVLYCLVFRVCRAEMR